MTRRLSVKQNAILNVLRSIVSVVFPIITYPYAARVVGVVNIGRVNYIASIVTYFSIIAVFGIDTYGVRECAGVRDDRDKASALASRIWTFSLISTVTALVCLGLVSFVYFPLHSYTPIILIQSLMIVFISFGADWINVVYEDYAYTTVRGIAINVVNLLILFLFVHRPEDYLVYAFLNISSYVFIGILNMVHLRRHVTLKLCRISNIKILLNELVPFFVNDMSIAVYVGMDITILGLMHGDYYVGIYSAAVKIYTIVKTVFIAIFSVTLAQLSSYISSGDSEKFKKLISDVISVFVILTIPAMTGLILYADSIILIVCGPEYSQSAMSLRLLAVALLFAAFGGIATRCANIPLGYERINTFATIVAAVSNTVLNIPMIMFLRETGAAVTTVLAEAGVLFICLANYKKHGRDWKALVVRKDLTDAIIGAAGLVIAFFAVTRLIPSMSVSGVVGMVLSVFLYFGILILLKNAVVTETLLNVVKRKNADKE